MQIDTGKAYTLFLFQFNVSFIYLGVTLAWKMIGAARGVLLLGEEATAAIVAIAAGLVWSLVMVSLDETRTIRPFVCASPTQPRQGWSHFTEPRSVMEESEDGEEELKVQHPQLQPLMA